MLFPSKHDHPDQTVIAVAHTMMKYMSRHRVAQYDALLEHCKKRHKVDYLFSPAVGILYVLGLVEYLPKSDSFEWVET